MLQIHIVGHSVCFFFLIFLLNLTICLQGVQLVAVWALCYLLRQHDGRAATKNEGTGISIGSIVLMVGTVYNKYEGYIKIG